MSQRKQPEPNREQAMITELFRDHFSEILIVFTNLILAFVTLADVWKDKEHESTILAIVRMFTGKGSKGHGKHEK